MAFQHLFVPRARIATFQVQLRIEDLNNVPPLSGVFYAKWKCQDHSGTSPRVPVVNQEVRWSHAVKKTIDIPISKDGVLTPCELKVAIKQVRVCADPGRLDYAGARQGRLGLAGARHREVYSHVRTKVGSLTVNLSEYARLSGSSRRYFLQECKLNCTLKLSILVSQQSGPESFDVPALDRSMVLTDLNDMITNENGTTRSGRDNSTKGATSFSSRQHSIMRNNSANGNLAFTSASSVHTNTTRSNTTETSTSRALLPIDNTDIRDLAPFQRSSKKNQQIVDDVFFSSPGLPT
ncbi:hypothetical protein LPJ64_005863 [Coemansia asiatica]|uniref:C2 NT-type domain-containing protein n=1 Tax=Coemansia asiatica TaxID=1052880 RepID=A0A9W7XG80_9FUNG|nr:hypothetical protein LPJ64_005863 [Coemansia asiatica]KAJ2881661.1 hypothetical protein FB639_002565 [Coemansia asiatica]